jgi:hypothetical protein
MNRACVLLPIYIENPFFTDFVILPYGGISVTQQAIFTVAKYVGLRRRETKIENYENACKKIYLD